MDLFIEMFNKKLKKLIKKGVKVVFSGSKDNLRSDVVSAMDNIVNKTKDNLGTILNICLEYILKLSHYDWKLRKNSQSSNFPSLRMDHC